MRTPAMTTLFPHFPRSIVLACAAVGLLFNDMASAQMAPAAAKALRDDGTYQNGGYWAAPLPWLMVAVMGETPAQAVRLFCDAVEDFQARKDLNAWVNDNAGMAAPGQTRRIVHYCLEHEDPFVFRGPLRQRPQGTSRGQPEPQGIGADRAAWPPVRLASAEIGSPATGSTRRAMSSGAEPGHRRR